MEKAVTCCKADQLVASLPSFYSIQSLLAVRKFRAAGEECCKQGHGQVCVNLMSWPQKCLRTIAADLPSDSLHQDLAWRAVTWRTSKTTKLSKLGGGYLARDNTEYSIFIRQIQSLQLTQKLYHCANDKQFMGEKKCFHLPCLSRHSEERSFPPHELSWTSDLPIYQVTAVHSLDLQSTVYCRESLRTVL